MLKCNTAKSVGGISSYCLCTLQISAFFFSHKDGLIHFIFWCKKIAVFTLSNGDRTGHFWPSYINSL